MKRQISLIGKNSDGVMACIMIETDAEWVPMDVRDQGKTAEFIPDIVYQIELIDDLGQRGFHIQTVERHGIDIRRRRGKAHDEEAA